MLPFPYDISVGRQVLHMDRKTIDRGSVVGVQLVYACQFSEQKVSKWRNWEHFNSRFACSDLSFMPDYGMCPENAS